ncbi:MAG TPA: FAD-binding oxidoreductase [Roseiflexaceae bacterium]|nr:FAD-binding oxidoreductase [Roseiflexaceae bacterium]
MITKSKLSMQLREAPRLVASASNIGGEILLPGHPEYDSARKLWNGLIDRYPALIVRAFSAADVASALSFARRAGLELAVRGGGHNSAGYAMVDGGMVIDLSRMKKIAVDPLGLTARMEPGVTLGEFVAATTVHGLATTTGTVSGTGMAGLTLGGGIGWLMGKYGLTIDNLLSVEIVTADGQIRHASADENGDLFWAVRGGGGNFGIVTAFEYRLHPIGQVLAGMVAHPLDRAEELLRFYRDYAHAAPDELTAYAAIVNGPGDKPVAAIAVCYDGPAEQGERLLAPLRAFGQPLVDTIRPMSYLETVHMLDAGSPNGRKYYDRANSMPELTDEAIATIADYAATRTSPFSQILIQHVHGAAARISPSAMAMHALRREQFLVGIIGAWEDGEAETHQSWVRAFWSETRQFSQAGTYVNFMSEDQNASVRAAYGPNYERLAAIKAKYDSENVFRLNLNIKPAS